MVRHPGERFRPSIPGQQSTVFPLSPAGLVFPGDAGIPKTLAPTTYNNFGPRLGLAYSPGFTDGLLGAVFGGPGKTSIRASYGLYYTSVEDLDLFYEVADAPFGLYWTSPLSVMMDEPFRVRTTGAILEPALPIHRADSRRPVEPDSGFLCLRAFQLFSGLQHPQQTALRRALQSLVQREITKSTVVTVAYVGTEGHRLITQQDANPGSAALCMQLTAEGAYDTTAQSAGCGPGNENDVFQLPGGTVPCALAPGQAPYQTPQPGCVYGTRQTILSPNFCPGGAQTCYGSNNTNTLTSANSIYNSAQVSVERKANNFTFLAAYTFSRALMIPRPSTI